MLRKYLDKYNEEVQELILDDIEKYMGELTSSSLTTSAAVNYSVVKPIELSARLYSNSKYVAQQTAKVINTHLKTKGTVEELRKLLYEGYEINDTEILQLKTKLPKYLLGDLTEAKLSKLKTKSLKAAYLDVLDAKNDKALEKALKNALYEKSRYYARRLSITEEAKAFNINNISKMLDSDVELVRWTRSGRQSIACICDYYENKDVGYGPGVYKIMEAPVPVFSTHPNCLCVLRDVGRPYNKQRKKTSDKDQRAIDYAKDHGWDEVKVRDLV